LSAAAGAVGVPWPETISLFYTFKILSLNWFLLPTHAGHVANMKNFRQRDSLLTIQPQYQLTASLSNRALLLIRSLIPELAVLLFKCSNVAEHSAFSLNT
jgi:hypothetical protein